MSRLRPSLVALVALAAVASACGKSEPAAPAVPAGPVEIGVTVDRDGASTALKLGHVLRVELPAEPERGFVWEVDSVDETVLRVPVEEYTPPDMTGEPGTSVWRFEAIGPGTTKLVLRYVELAAEVPTEARTFTFRVLVD